MNLIATTLRDRLVFGAADQIATREHAHEQSFLVDHRIALMRAAGRVRREPAAYLAERVQQLKRRCPNGIKHRDLPVSPWIAPLKREPEISRVAVISFYQTVERAG